MYLPILTLKGHISHIQLAKDTTNSAFVKAMCLSDWQIIQLHLLDRHRVINIPCPGVVLLTPYIVQ